MEFAARYQDGIVASVRPAIGLLDAAAEPPILVILDAATREVVARWPVEACYLLHTRMMELRIGNFDRPDGARLAVTGMDAMRNALQLLPAVHRHRRVDMRRQASVIVLATMALFSIIVAYLYGIPLLSDRLVVYFPPEWEIRVGATAAGQIEATLTEGRGYSICETDPQAPGNRAIRRFTEAAFDGLDSPFAPTVTVIRSDIPNAFALPGGQTYYLSALIDAARTPDEFAGVLAHELGHVYYRHGMQTLIATSTTGLLVGFVLGDMTGLSVAGAIGSSLIDNRFSRQSESRADEFAGNTALRLGYDPAGLGDLLDRVATDDAFARAFALFSNHPLTDERRRALDALGDGRPAARPAFTDDEWRSIKAMCRTSPQSWLGRWEAASG